MDKRIRFENVKYLHTDICDDVIEIKFSVNFTHENFDNDLHLLELWVQGNSNELVITNSLTNEIIETNKFELNYVKNLFKKDLKKYFTNN